MSSKHENMSLFEQLKAGLEDSIAYSRGELTLVTTKLPAPPPKLGAAAVRAIRDNLHMSQAVFAAIVNVSKKTVQSWEQGARQPSDAALRLLQVVRAEPGVVRAIFRGGARVRRTPSTRRAKLAVTRAATVGKTARARPARSTKMTAKATKMG